MSVIANETNSRNGNVALWKPILAARRGLLPILLLLVVIVLGTVTTPCLAQVAQPPQATEEKSGETKSGDETPKTDDAPKTKEELLERQRQIAAQYQRFEEMLLRMAEFNAVTNPRRAALLRRVIAESREQLLNDRFAELNALLESGKYTKALEAQKDLQNDLMSLMKILILDADKDRTKEAIAQTQAYIQAVNKLIRRQKNEQRQTEESDDLESLADPQEKIAEKTGDLKDTMKKNSGGKPGEGKPGKGKPGEGKPGEGKPGEGKPGEGKPGEGKPGEGKPGEGKPGEGKPGEQGESEQKELYPTKSIQKQLDDAQKAMEKAAKDLENAEREGALEKQDIARRALDEAKKALEEILRQLRLDEKEKTLLALEERIKQMLKGQEKINGDTLKLQDDGKTKKASQREFENRSGVLSSRETMIVRLADGTMLLFQEDGTVLAMPEVMSQAREDMRQVVTRLAQAKVDSITIETEKEIVAALEEMLEAVQKELEEVEKQKSGKSKPQKPGVQPLVDQLAELKMLRSMEKTIKRRTVGLENLSKDTSLEKTDIDDSHRELARRQERVYEITRDIAAGKNQ